MGKRFGNASLGWYLRQLLPLSYSEHHIRFRENAATGEHTNVTWRMWFGRCLNVRITRV